MKTITKISEISSVWEYSIRTTDTIKVNYNSIEYKGEKLELPIDWFTILNNSISENEKIIIVRQY